jgi:hypothetical protein
VRSGDRLDHARKFVTAAFGLPPTAGSGAGSVSSPDSRIEQQLAVIWRGRCLPPPEPFAGLNRSRIGQPGLVG